MAYLCDSDNADQAQGAAGPGVNGDALAQV